MAQFQAYRNPRASRDRVPFLLDVQSDIVTIATRLVAPLMLEKDFETRLPRLNPRLHVGTAAVVMSTADLAGVPLRDLREWVADLSPQRAEIQAAIDFLLLGY